MRSTRITLLATVLALASQACAGAPADAETRTFTVHRQIAHGDEANIMELTVPYQLGRTVEKTGDVCWQSVTRQTGEEKHVRTLVDAGRRVSVEEVWPVLAITKTVVACGENGL